MLLYIYMVDTTSPVVSLNGISVININQWWIFTDPWASWSDNVDGSGTNVVVSGSIDTNTVGTYILTYTYTDVGGNISNTVLRTVNVVSIPITLSSEWWWAWLAKDSCPNGDYSFSYYDAQCGNKPKVESWVFEWITTTISSCQEPDYKLASFQNLKKLSQRKQFIVCRLYKNKQTIFDNVPEFDYNRMVTREEASKMIGRFIKNILNKEPIRRKSDKKCNFIDLNQSNPYLVSSIKESCLYGVFNGTSSNKFLPKQNLTQAHAIATVLRSSYGYQDENWNTPWFSPYIKLLRDKNLWWKNFSTYDSISLLEQEGISRWDLWELMYRVAVDIFDHK